jgi:hypothetical protein
MKTVYRGNKNDLLKMLDGIATLRSDEALLVKSKIKRSCAQERAAGIREAMDIIASWEQEWDPPSEESLAVKGEE